MAELLVLVGAGFTFVAALGTLRFADVFSRMHALTKASTLGLLLVVAGAIVRLDHPNDRTSLVLAALLHVLTTPVGGNLLSRATYFAEGIPHGIDTVDELADAPPGPDPG